MTRIEPSLGSNTRTSRRAIKRSHAMTPALVAKHKSISNLTPQQWRVLGCVGEGLSNKAIAIRLGIVVSTVKGHLCAVFDRLGCTNRTEAALIALRYRNSQFND